MSEGSILITGATSGFGEACARRFAKDGRKLIITGRRSDRLEKLKEELKPKSDIHTITMDVRDKNAVFEAVSNLPASFADVDILVNNAGLALGLEPSQKTDIDEWETMVDTNIKGLMYCTRAVLPSMVERDCGHIINMGSVAGNWPYPGANTYGATKAFVKQFSLNLRADLNGTKIRVTNIEPGLAETEFSIVRFNGDTDKASETYRGTDPLTGEDIAEIVYWTSSLPPHVNINRVEVMATCQAWNPFAIHRKE